MSWPSVDRWNHLWKAIGAAGDPDPWYDLLTRAYAQPGRHYHNQRHISECLDQFDRARSLAQQPDAIELALWFHDAVYDPRAGDNEEQSAAMARECLEKAGLPALAAAVSDLVMATKSHRPEAGSDAALMVDIDLSILGQEPARFDEYEAQIREEYRWVPLEVFNPKRAEILQRFLARERIYSTDFFATRCETQSRGNLERSVQRLRGHPN
jgi:predicted metal-dependent HD superfamily phosphohydrolase